MNATNTTAGTRLPFRIVVQVNEPHWDFYIQYDDGRDVDGVLDLPLDATPEQVRQRFVQLAGEYGIQLTVDEVNESMEGEWFGWYAGDEDE